MSVTGASGAKRATLSFDLDNQWAYLKIHGDKEWEQYPSYLQLVVPRALALMDELGVKATFFVVGKDAQIDENRAPLQAISRAQHEIGNHSFSHESWLHLYSEAEIREELNQAERWIEEATGVLPRGFRGPGYSLSKAVLSALCKKGYLYDASTLPTFIGPIARAYYLWNSNLTKSERERRNLLFGSWGDAFKPLKPYYWMPTEGRILEIPVTTFPLLRVPFHLSYVTYLATISVAMANRYWQTALRTCAMLDVEPSILLHPLDLVSNDDVPSLSFFPAMAMKSSDKINLVRRCLKGLKEQFTIMTLGEFAAMSESTDRLQQL